MVLVLTHQHHHEVLCLGVTIHPLWVTVGAVVPTAGVLPLQPLLLYGWSEGCKHIDISAWKRNDEW